ncbi:MAG: hypothetical protein CME70_18985 [Halobacteriovorax sp.]|nr:hypothetical protein [Halobacteriovorax sp.]
MKNFTLLCSLLFLVGCPTPTPEPEPDPPEPVVEVQCQTIERCQLLVQACLNEMCPKYFAQGKSAADAFQYCTVDMTARHPIMRQHDCAQCIEEDRRINRGRNFGSIISNVDRCQTGN